MITNKRMNSCYSSSGQSESGLRSTCDHGFISLPYLDGRDLEIFTHEEKEINCYWFIPITEKERDYKIDRGCDALEELFEQKQFDYLDRNRKSLV